MNREQRFLELYRTMVTARALDLQEMKIVKQGHAFFHVSGMGHEATAALQAHLRPEDWLHCHYRDKALMLARGLTPQMFFDSLYCNARSHSKGRQMSAHLSDRDRNVMSITGPVGNAALQAVGVADAIKTATDSPLVLCSMGEGTSQEGEVLEAMAEAVRAQLPVLFLVQDNGYSISTPTGGQTLYDHPSGRAKDFYGMGIMYLDGTDVGQVDAGFREIVTRIRQKPQPGLVVLGVARLSDHTSSDHQEAYKSADQIVLERKDRDPLQNLRATLLEAGIAPATLKELEAEVAAEVQLAAEQSVQADVPEAALEAKSSLPDSCRERQEYRGSTENRDVTMLHAIRGVLQAHLRDDESILLFGQDIADPKGDVFGLTKGLSSAYPDRVKNAPLTESTIVGKAIGQAMAGKKPIAFLQFADFVPLAFNQIASELATLYWRTAGSWSAPVVIMAPCGGFKPGLGPFHAQMMDATLAHIPGLDVYMPSNAADAAGMLNAALASGRPSIYLYPKNRLNNREEMTSADVDLQYIPIGRARKLTKGQDLTCVAWGNTVSLCREAVAVLEKQGHHCDLIDLRSLSPWDEDAVRTSAQKTGKLLVVHEDNLTCGIGAEVIAKTVEGLPGQPLLCRRVARYDTHIPCNYSNQLEVLPSYKRILETASDMLGYAVEWLKPEGAESGSYTLHAIGFSPSDEAVRITDWLVQEGAEIKSGMLLATFEADKAAGELEAPVSGRIEKILVAPDAQVKVGTPLMTIATDTLVKENPLFVTKEDPGQPRFVKRRMAHRPVAAGAHNVLSRVGIGGLSYVPGARKVSNEEILQHYTDDSSFDIFKKTGIRSRYWVGEGEDALSLGLAAARKTLAQKDLPPSAIDLLICSTTTPLGMSPTLSCQILGELGEDEPLLAQAYDVNAACCGYLYALQLAYDFLKTQPQKRVLVVTVDVLSPLLNPADFGTYSTFGDAASASLICGQATLDSAEVELLRPELSAQGDTNKIISVPFPGSGAFIEMKINKAFIHAVNMMGKLLQTCCARENIDVGSLDFLIPHQSNQRIMDSLRQKLGFPAEKVISTIANYGNTSSSSIPMALHTLLPGCQREATLGIASFGGGLTFGASLLKVRKEQRATDHR